jgi:hypothetical protein
MNQQPKATACTNKDKTKEKKETKPKHTASTSATLGGKHSGSPKGSETKQPPLGQTTQGE